MSKVDKQHNRYSALDHIISIITNPRVKISTQKYPSQCTQEISKVKTEIEKKNYKT